MIQLSREIRFALVSPKELKPQIEIEGLKNSWASWPASCRIVPHLVLGAVVAGNPDPVTGYLCNVAVIDQTLRSFVNERLIPSVARLPIAELPFAEQIVRSAWHEMQHANLDGSNLASVHLSLSQYLKYEISAGASSMVQLTQQFEFSAAHRLNCDSLTPEENFATFGKCNNPAGHGHNYVVEVSVSRDIPSDDEQKEIIGLNQLAQIVNSKVIDPLDHKNLYQDIEYFKNVNPSVENICAAIFQWLKPSIENAGCSLSLVKVYETPKTWASFSG
jgi:6-pyruvoyltetrahydropterin/6-carboxytetrahydropterin synthase